MKICIVTETYPPEVNGVAMTLSRISKELQLQGHTVTIVDPASRLRRATPLMTTLIVAGLPLPDMMDFASACPAARSFESTGIVKLQISSTRRLKGHSANLLFVLRRTSTFPSSLDSTLISTNT